MQVAGKARRDDAPPRLRGEDAGEHRPDVALRTRTARLLGVGRVGQQQADPGVRGDGPDAGQIRAAAVDGKEIQFEVTGVQQHALRRADSGDDTTRHRVGDGDELAVEWADTLRLAVADGDQPSPIPVAGLDDAAARQSQREGRAVDVAAHSGQKVTQGSHVVLMAVGGDAAHDLSGPLEHIGKIGQDRVDAGAVVAGEHLPAVQQ